MKIGVIVELLGLPLREGILRAGSLGVDGIQLHALRRSHSLLDLSSRELAELGQFIKEQGLIVSAVCGDIPGHGFSIPAENTRKIEIEKRIIDLLPALGCSIVTMHIGVVPSCASAENYEPMVAALSELGNHAHQAGAVLAIETGPEPSVVLRDFIRATKSAGVGVNLDPANFVMVLNEDPVGAVRTLGDLIVHTHAKDGVHYAKCDPVRVYGAFAEGGFDQLVKETGQLFAEVPLGAGQVAWRAYLQELKLHGYDGFLTVEREVGADPESDIRAAIDFINKEIEIIN